MGLLFDCFCLDILSIIVALLCILLTFLKYSFSYWSRRNVPFIQTKIPFGNAKDMILQNTSFGETIEIFYQEFKSRGAAFGGYYVFNVPRLLIVDIELIKIIMSRDFQYFSDKTFRLNEKQEPLTGHLLALTGTKWKKMRQKLTPTFTSGKMKMMFNTLLACADGLEEIMDEYVKNNDDIDIKDVLGRFTTDIIGSCAFGLDCNSLKDPDAEFRVYGRKIFASTPYKGLLRIVARIYPNFSNIFKIREFDRDVSDFFINVVADTIEYREKNNVHRNDFLQLLINIKNTSDVDAKDGSKGEGLTLDEIAAQCFIFFLAGFETSSTAMSFFLYDMAIHQDIQDKVRKEINEVLNKQDGKLTYDSVMEMHYLDKVVSESMRIHSPVPVIQRICTKEYKIPDSDVIIEKDTVITIPILGIHNDPEFYPDPTKFDPERFSHEEKENRHSYSFIPFGEGPRICLGQRFGLLQTKVGLIVLLKNHRFTLSKKTKLPLKLDPKVNFSSASGGIWTKAERVFHTT